MKNFEKYRCSFLIRKDEFQQIAGLVYLHYKKIFPKMNLIFIEKINDSIIKKINSQSFIWIRKPYKANILKKINIPILVQDERFRSNEFSEKQFKQFKSFENRNKIFFLTDKSYNLDSHCINDPFFLFTELKKKKIKKDIDVLFIGTQKNENSMKIFDGMASNFLNFFGDFRKKFRRDIKYNFLNLLEPNFFAKMVTRIKYLRRVSIFKSLKYLSAKYKFYSIGYDPNCSTIKYIPFANKEKVIQYARRSKILIINTSMHTYTINERFSLALPLGCIALVEKYPQYKYKNFLQKYGFSYSRSNLEKKLIRILSNYQYYKNDFAKYNKVFTNKLNSKKVVRNLFKTFFIKSKIN